VNLEQLAERALAVDGIESAAIFVTQPGSSELVLVGAAGIDGPPLDGLVAAVRRPEHPIARSLTDAGPTFDVHPMNPGGPALRSHLPFAGQRGRGVFAVAHDAPLSREARAALEGLAEAAAA
jgi:hypothetical protein